MSKVREKVFVHVVSNIAIFLVVVAVFTISFSGKIVSVINAEKNEPYYHGNLDKKQVSLMINVYWGDEYMDDILEILERNNARVTFFVGGSYVQRFPQMLIKMDQKGHEIGNHGQFHKDHKLINDSKNREEIKVCEDTVMNIIGVKTKLFAPPSGSFSDTTLAVCKELGYKTIMWTKDTIDWRDKDSELVYKRATKNPKNGDLVLMHPTAHTVKALERIIKFYQGEGFKVTTVTENIS